MDANYFKYQIMTARRRYETSGDHEAYMADCFYMAVYIAAEAIAQKDGRLKHLPKTVSAASYAIKGLADMVASNLSCPIEEGHNHEDFLQSWYTHGRRFVDRDTQVVRDVLTYIGLWPRS